MEVIWSKHAESSFSDELEFILLKWNLKSEIEKGWSGATSNGNIKDIITEKQKN